MKVHPIQESFIGGQVSRNVQGNVTSDIYDKSVERLENFIPTPQGSVKFRSGTVSAGRPVNNVISDATPRLLPFNPAMAIFALKLGITPLLLGSEMVE